MCAYKIRSENGQIKDNQEGEGSPLNFQKKAAGLRLLNSDNLGTWTTRPSEKKKFQDQRPRLSKNKGGYYFQENKD